MGEIERAGGGLSAAESTRLAECEARIGAGLQTFFEVGNALLEVRDGRLYRAEFETFEAYCRKRWGIGASRARQLIGAAGVVSNLESVTTVTPTNEAQARELAALAGNAQQVVWAFAVASAPVVDDSPHITAAHIKRAAYTVELLQAHGWQGDGITPARAFLIDEEFYGVMPDADAETFAGMERSILRLGLINPLDVWGNTIVDGHERYFICMRHGLPFEVCPREFADRAAVFTFIEQAHFTRKNYTPAELERIRVALVAEGLEALV